MLGILLAIGPDKSGYQVDIFLISPQKHTMWVVGLGENRKNSRSGPKLRILDRFQTPQNANKLVQQVCASNPIFPQPTNFHESMMSKKSQTVKSSQTDNICAPFKCGIMVVKRLV